MNQTAAQTDAVQKHQAEACGKSSGADHRHRWLSIPGSCLLLLGLCTVCEGSALVLAVMAVVFAEGAIFDCCDAGPCCCVVRGVLSIHDSSEDCLPVVRGSGTC